MIETDAIFSTNCLNMLLFVFFGIINTRLSFPVQYCYISSESKERFFFMFACMQENMSYEKCLSPYIILRDFAVDLWAAMMKTPN